MCFQHAALDIAGLSKSSPGTVLRICEYAKEHLVCKCLVLYVLRKL